MAYSIVGDKCINCGVCESECPVDAITEDGDSRVINEETCISCGACMNVCPEDCINEG